MGEDTNLERSLGLGSLTASGVGVMIGAGIYVLIGEIIGLVGGGAWLAFVAAALAALPTGLAYAELASRYPRAAGEAVFVDRAFGRPLLTFIVGFVVLSSGVTSVAAVSHGFAAYLGDLIGDPLGLGALAAPLAIVLFLVALSALNHRGIAASTRLNTICTVASVAGLVILIAAGIPRWGSVDLWTIGAVADGTGAGVEQGSLAVILGGAALAFYAFVGFEDLCNVAEEVQAPSRTIPRAILLSMAIAAVVYVGVAITAVSAVPAAELASSPVPLVRVWERLLPGLSSAWLALVALFATTNTALVNLIMGSRVLFGMGRDGWIPALFARVDRRRATPTVGVLAVFALSLAVALTGFLQVLAQATNLLILVAFVAVDLALLVVRLRGVAADDPQAPIFRVPLFVPALGLCADLYLLTLLPAGAYLRGGVLLALGGVLYVIARRAREQP